ncbi:MAG TPA: hypothetical protein VFR90_09955 [Methylibium sp.]|uniref:hypothetical protein n=1 Tax=Methylibium sp. TaxID=2067992 RepID=UPI002DBBE300|nr:hypothetical protein [Methylibium sp.]HEU4459433.1 hypothetical protein [Methylibium sp.]
MDLQVPIKVFDELEDEVIRATGLLDLASGEVRNLQYENYDLAKRGRPCDLPDYDFTSGTLSNAGKDVEFRVEIDVFTGKYSVSPSELLELKVRAAKLFAGIGGKDLAAGVTKPPGKPH